MGAIDRLRGSFVAGLILVTPLVVTVYVVQILVNWSLAVLNPIVEGTRLAAYTPDVAGLPQALAAVLIVATITALGVVAQYSVGRRLFGNAGRIVNVVPLINTVYSSVRQVANSLVDRNDAYESVVLVEYPREGIYAVGLVTGESPEPVEEIAGERAYNVYLPNSPNPTGGRLALVPEDRLHETDMSVRRGMRLLVTTGTSERNGGVAGLPDDPISDRDDAPARLD